MNSANFVKTAHEKDRHVIFHNLLSSLKLQMRLKMRDLKCQAPSPQFKDEPRSRNPRHDTDVWAPSFDIDHKKILLGTPSTSSPPVLA